MNKVYIYTDGACRGNPGPGGWGAVLKYGATTKTIKGGELETTNNRMELTAAIEALTILKRSCQVELYTDSQYLKQGMTTWVKDWINNQWKTSSKKPVKNKELWQQLVTLSEKHQVQWHWLKAHAGHPENEQADELANLAIDEIMM